MKQFLSFLALVVALMVCASTAFAQANTGDNFRNDPQSIQWLNRAGTAYVDTITILSADTLRTANINTDGWDWSQAGGQAASAYVPTNLAKIVFFSSIAQTNANLVGDSLYFAIEPSYDGGKTYVPWTYQPAVPLGTFAGAVGNCALQSNAMEDASPHSYEGYLAFDKDNTSLVPAPHNNLYGIRDFRLLVHGDVSSTAQAFGGCKIYIMAPRASVVR